MFANLKHKLNVTSDAPIVHRTTSSKHEGKSARKNSETLSITSSSVVEDCSSMISNSVSKRVLSNLLLDKSNEIETLKDKVKELTDMLEECALTIDSLNDEKKRYHSQLHRLKSEDEMKEYMDKMKDENQKLILMNTKLRNDNAKLIKQVDTISTSNNEDSDHNECLLRQMDNEHKITVLEENIDRLKKDDLLMEAERCTMVTELDMYIDKLTKYENKINTLEKENTLQTNECKTKDTEIENITEQLNSSNNQLKILNEDSIALNNELEQLKKIQDKDLDSLNLENKLLCDKNDNTDVDESNAKIIMLQKDCATLRDDVYHKNQTIKNEQTKLKDLKKLMQKELHIKPEDDTNVMNTKHIDAVSKKNEINTNLNLEYIRNVILKFLLCTENESLQLVKALSTLLKFSREEEVLLSNTLQWRQSWFGGNKPKLENGTLSFRHS